MQKVNINAPYWLVKKNLKNSNRSKTELSDLAAIFSKTNDVKSYASSMAGPVKEIPVWLSIITNTAVGLVNVMLSIGGTISEFEFILKEVYKSDRFLFKKWGGFLKNENGETEENYLKYHIKYICGGAKRKYSDPPAKGYVFQSNSELDRLSSYSYVQAVGVWKKEDVLLIDERWL